MTKHIRIAERRNRVILGLVVLDEVTQHLKVISLFRSETGAIQK